MEIENRSRLNKEEKELWWQYDASSRGREYSEHRIRWWLWKFFGKYVFKVLIGPLNGPRVFWLRLFGARIGKGNFISNHAIIVYPAALQMGDENSIDDYVYFNADTILGDRCQLSSYAKIISGGHDVRSRRFEYQHRPVRIGNSAFIGANAVIMGGVSIGTFAAIGANSFVLHDVKDNTIAYGIPCEEHGERIPSEDFANYKF